MQVPQKLSSSEVRWASTGYRRWCPGTSRTLPPASHILHFPPLTRHHFFWSPLFRPSQLMLLLICGRYVDDGPSWLNVKLCNIAGDKKKKKLFQLKHHSQLSTLHWWKHCMACTLQRGSVYLYIYRERFFNKDKNCVNNQWRNILYISSNWNFALQFALWFSLRRCTVVFWRGNGCRTVTG